MSCAKMLDELCPFSFFITFAEGRFSSKDKLMKIPMVEKFFRDLCMYFWSKKALSIFFVMPRQANSIVYGKDKEKS